MSLALGWLRDPSEPALREALAAVAPNLADRPLVIADRPGDDERYFQSSAVVDGSFVVKFAWSEPPARRIVREHAVLRVLQRSLPTFPLPQVVAAAADPALLVTSLIPGQPLTGEAATAMHDQSRALLLADLAGLLAALHALGTLAAVRAAGIGLETPRLQAETGALRDRLDGFVGPDWRAIVRRWCDWTDAVLGAPSETALVHGDLHGHNLVCELSRPEIRLVVDWESAGPGDPAFDFRYLPAQAADMRFFVDLIEAYAQASGRRIDTDRAMAWHIRTVLGDVLWRTEAGVGLPGGASPASRVEELAVRLAALGVEM